MIASIFGDSKLGPMLVKSLWLAFKWPFIIWLIYMACRLLIGPLVAAFRRTSRK